jgi:Ca2+-binding RTX toxin-like protein
VNTPQIIKTLAVIGAAGAFAIVPTGSAFGDELPHHDGPPGVWGPPLAGLCANPNAAAAQGYVVRILNNNANVFTGNNLPEAIYALGGNDKINGAGGDDVICLGTGDDEGAGSDGNDAIFGEVGNDTLWGNLGNDYLDGGLNADACNGNAGANVLVSC